MIAVWQTKVYKENTDKKDILNEFYGRLIEIENLCKDYCLNNSIDSFMFAVNDIINDIVRPYDTGYRNILSNDYDISQYNSRISSKMVFPIIKIARKQYFALLFYLKQIELVGYELSSKNDLIQFLENGTKLFEEIANSTPNNFGQVYNRKIIQDILNCGKILRDNFIYYTSCIREKYNELSKKNVKTINIELAKMGIEKYDKE